jgi:hypothetical protein
MMPECCQSLGYELMRRPRLRRSACGLIIRAERSHSRIKGVDFVATATAIDIVFEHCCGRRLGYVALQRRRSSRITSLLLPHQLPESLENKPEDNSAGGLAWVLTPPGKGTSDPSCFGFLTASEMSCRRARETLHGARPSLGRHPLATAFVARAGA